MAYPRTWSRVQRGWRPLPKCLPNVLNKVMGTCKGCRFNILVCSYKTSSTLLNLKQLSAI